MKNWPAPMAPASAVTTIIRMFEAPNDRRNCRDREVGCVEPTPAPVAYVANLVAMLWAVRGGGVDGAISAYPFLGLAGLVGFCCDALVRMGPVVVCVDVYVVSPDPFCGWTG